MHILKHWQNKEKMKVLERTLYNCSADELKFLCECAVKMFKGNVLFNVDRLLTYEKELKV